MSTTAEVQGNSASNERLAEQFIQDLPPMSEKRVTKHRTFLRNVSSGETDSPVLRDKSKFPATTCG